MNRLIRFYLGEVRNFIELFIGFHILNNILEILLKGQGLTSVWSMILPLIILIYLIKFNLSDTGKETFTFVSMTDNSPTKILLSKLIVSYVFILMLSAVNCIFIIIHNIYQCESSWKSILMLPAWSIFVTTMAICYISYFIIWIKSFSINKISRKIIVISAVVIWLVINVTVRNHVFLFSIDAVHGNRYFGGSTMTVWSILWHLTWCTIFFLVTAYLQKKKINQI